MRLLAELSYRVQRVLHDDGRIERLEDVSEFPDQVWTDESIRLCDYLFVPASDLSLTDKVLLG
jgi:hypothetical protein